MFGPNILFINFLPFFSLFWKTAFHITVLLFVAFNSLCLLFQENWSIRCFFFFQCKSTLWYNINLPFFFLYFQIFKSYFLREHIPFSIIFMLLKHVTYNIKNLFIGFLKAAFDNNFQKLLLKDQYPFFPITFPCLTKFKSYNLNPFLIVFLKVAFHNCTIF